MAAASLRALPTENRHPERPFPITQDAAATHRAGKRTGWSSGGGRMLPSRRTIGPTNVEVPVGGGGTGVGAGVRVGGDGWVMVVPYVGGGGVVAAGLIRSARLVAWSSRGTPRGGRPRRSTTVRPMLRWEFHRLSMPGRTRPPKMSSGTRGPQPSCTPSGVCSTFGVTTWSSKPPVVQGELEHGVGQCLAAVIASTACRACWCCSWGRTRPPRDEWWEPGGTTSRRSAARGTRADSAGAGGGEGLRLRVDRGGGSLESLCLRLPRPP
ncbi:MAG: hypothetical protein QOJ11_3480 [Frankiales bacterium]|nr:hypothetical protein [Frankiales bacterium]